jgi:hypothetical protein
MTLVHYNAITKTSCSLSKNYVNVSNKVDDVNCVECIKVIAKNLERKQSMQACPTCDTLLPETHPAFLMTDLLRWVKDQGGWDVFEAAKYTKGATFTVNGYTAEIADIKDTYDSGDIDVEGYYGESALPQGSTFDGYIVIKIGNTYFKKTGTGDSYGEMSWDGDLKRVTPKVKTIEVYE